MWRLVYAQEADLSELDTYYTVADLMRANELLDAKIEAQTLAARRAQAKGR